MASFMQKKKNHDFVFALYYIYIEKSSMREWWIKGRSMTYYVFNEERGLPPLYCCSILKTFLLF